MPHRSGVGVEKRGGAIGRPRPLARIRRAEQRLDHRGGRRASHWSGLPGVFVRSHPSAARISARRGAASAADRCQAASRPDLRGAPRTLSKRQRSGWSEPSGRFTVPEDGGAPATAVGVPEASAKRPPDRPAAAKAPKAGGRSALNELKNNPELSAKLSKQFPGVDPTAAAAGFRTVRDLGAALFLASNLDVPFPELKKLTADAGNRDFAKAIATLKPGVNAKAEEQKAIKQSRQTFRAPAKSRK